MKSLNRVVRYHRWLRDIALPQESASTNAFSTATQLDRTTAKRLVLAAWLPFVFVTRTVMCAAKMNGARASQAASTFRQIFPTATAAQACTVRREPEQNRGTLSPPGQRACSGA